MAAIHISIAIIVFSLMIPIITAVSHRRAEARQAAEAAALDAKRDAARLAETIRRQQADAEKARAAELARAEKAARADAKRLEREARQAEAHAAKVARATELAELAERKLAAEREIAALRSQRSATIQAAPAAIPSPVRPSSPTRPDHSAPKPFAGQIVAFTGTLLDADGRRVTRREAIELVQRLGGRAFETMPAGTTLLVVGERPGNAKLDKADAWLGQLRKLTPAQFFRMAADNSPTGSC